MKYSPSTRLPMSLPCMSVKATMTVSISPFLTSAASCSLVSKPSPRGLFIAAAGSGDEALEKVARPGQVGGELFGVALDGDDQAVVRLHPLHRAVLGRSCLLEPVGQALDRLMVQAVDADLVLARSPAQLRVRVDIDGVGQ